MFDVYYYNPICRMIELMKWLRDNECLHRRTSTRELFLEYYEKNKELDAYIARYPDYYIWYLNNHLAKKHKKAIVMFSKQTPLMPSPSRLVVRTLINSKSQ